MSTAATRVAVVTGAARGIGRATAAALAKNGFAVALVDVRAPELREAATIVRDAGTATLALEGDVTSFATAQRLGGEILSAWGRVDVLVNNAGISQPKGLLEITEEEWDRTIDTHLKGAFNWCKAVAPTMLAQRSGRIINMSSVSAHTGAGTAAVSKSAYCAAKAGILGLTRGLAKELAPDVIVNAICPGLIATDLTAGMIARAGEATLLRTIPLARLGTPEDIAQVVVFLATVTPCFMTGEVLDVDGGQWVN
jgi:3-oxoacyl-[acyl-carrier protein] reductase